MRLPARIGAAVLAAALSLAPAQAAPWGPKPVAVLDLWRARPGADKVHIMVGLPDGSEALFLVDTGAAVNVLNRAWVERLALTVRTVPGSIEGLSGSAPWRTTRVPSIRLGDVTLEGIDFAVDVPGVPERSGALPVAGILGADVLGRFVVDLDDGADRLSLWAPGTLRLPRRATPLAYEGGHARTRVKVTAKGAPARSTEVLLDVDTGARDVLLIGGQASALLPSATRGLEPVYGIGASLDELPPESFLARTARVPLAEVAFAGGKAVLEERAHARWLRPEAPADSRGGLLGYEAWADRRVVLDFPGGRFALTRSRAPKRTFDGVAAMLARMEPTWSQEPAHAADLARLQLSADRDKDALATLRRARAARPEDAEVALLLAGMFLAKGDVAGALHAMDGVPAVALAEEHGWVTRVGLLLQVQGPGDALAAAESAARLVEDATPPHVRAELLVAWSDALLANQQAAGAERVLRQAIEVGGSGHLLRGARLAMRLGDHDGAMAQLRTLTQRYPLDGTALWLRARAAHANERDAVRRDLDLAVADLHPDDIAHDFIGAALLALGEADRGAAMLAEGRVQDCERLGTPERDNCEAWYDALAGVNLDAATSAIDRALAAAPHRAGFLDTAATVARARGDLQAAAAYARRAADLQPADPYLLWQVDDLSGLVR